VTFPGAVKGPKVTSPESHMGRIFGYCGQKDRRRMGQMSINRIEIKSKPKKVVTAASVCRGRHSVVVVEVFNIGK